MAKTKKNTSRAAYWQKHISQWSKSGLTQAEYCRRNEISAAAFHWWKRHLRKKSNTQKDSSTSMQFVEVHGVPPTHAGRGEIYEVVLSRGRAIVDLRAGRVGGVIAWMLVDLALSTGLRVNEMAALKLKDVNLKRSCLSVIRLKRKKKARETLALGKDIAQHLKDYIAWTDRKKGPLFLGSRGSLTAQGLQRIWKRSVKLAGLPKELSIHSARHTIAVHLLKKTGNLRQVQKQLGHASPATTANMYADISFEDMQDGVTGLYQ